jgi:uncharacterized protein YcbX
MTIDAVRRYPVKAMAGESLPSARLDARGVAGDRWFAVRDVDGHFASAKNTRRFRRRDAVLDYAAATVDGEVVVSGARGVWTVGDPALDAELSRTVAAPVTVVSETGVPHFDAGSVSLVGTATLNWCARRWGIDADPRRLRVNLVVQTDEPFAEESWVDRELRVGAVTLRVVERVERCRTIDVAQDGTSARGQWLKPLAAERDMCVAVYADVVEPGELSVGDSLLPS